MAQAQISMSDDALRVLRLVRTQAMDGYTVLAKARLSPSELEKAAMELSSNGLIEIKGDLSPDAIGEAYLWIPPHAKRYASFLLQQLRASR